MLQYLKVSLKKEKNFIKFNRQLKELGKIAGKNGVTVECQGPENIFDDKNRKDTLFLTDDEEMLDSLLDAGYCAAGLIHAENKNTGFRGNCYLMEFPDEWEDSDFLWLEGVYRRLAGLPLDVLHTEHFLLRESTVEDVDAFYKIYREGAVTKYMDALFENPSDEKEYMKKYIREIYGFYGYGIWTVIKEDTQEIIGRAGISIREGYDLPELGYVIGVPWQKKGYAYEVCEGILSYAAKILHFEEMQAFVRIGNEASVQLLKKLGFSFKEECKIREETYLRYQVHLGD